MIISTEKVDKKVDYYSISRLKTYVECSYEYFHKYVEPKHVSSISSSTLIGNILHAALEYLYGVDDDEVLYLVDALRKTIKTSLVKYRIVTGLSEDEVDYVNDLLEGYFVDAKSLYLRAHKDYTGKDAIRTGEGKVPQNAQATSSWKAAAIPLDLPKRKEIIDTFISGRNAFIGDISVVDVYSESFILAEKYRTPPAFKEMLSVEMPISLWDEEKGELYNPVKMPLEYGGDKDIYLHGYIDLIARVDVGDGLKLALIDHKSSKSSYKQDEVACNRQLMAYAYAYEYLTGEKVDMVGINNLRDNTLVLAYIDREKMEESMKSIFSIHKLIEMKYFVKHVPDDQYSPCKNMFNKPCPYLQNCWPDTYESVIASKSKWY